MNKSKKFILFVLFTLYAITNLQAKTIEIQSDKLIIDRDIGISTFHKNVYAQSKDFEIWSEKLILSYNKDIKEIEKIRAKGKVKIIRLDLVVIGDSAVFYPIENHLKIIGNVILEENDNKIQCDELFMDLNDSSSIMNSKSNNRVKAIISSNNEY